MGTLPAAGPRGCRRVHARVSARPGIAPSGRALLLRQPLRSETMGILNIAPAERAGAHLLIQLYGPPRSGKTYTALRIARGMVGPKGRIGVLDTESGRARLYSDKVPGGFVVGELTPPRNRPTASGKLGAD